MSQHLIRLITFYITRRKQWLLDIKERDSHKARIFFNAFCFIEHLCAINDHMELDINYNDIYISEEELKIENVLTSEASFLDRLSSIIKNKNLRLNYLIKEIHTLFL